jgi:uncharacterized integral membrane protein (TIGR00698 family)
VLNVQIIRTVIRKIFPGVLIAGLIAVSAQFISDHYGAPSMLMGLLLGISLNFLSVTDKCGPGIDFASRRILRFGVALLGIRISFEMAVLLGWPTVLLVFSGVLLTIFFGLAVSRLFGHGYQFAFLSAGSVAICGASAAMAISAILPRDERSEERLVFTVVGVTLLSTLAMILYPIFAEKLGLDARPAGVFLGATIHDVAQVVGAGFSVSEDVGEVATVIKLIRVAMLGPIILVAAVIIRRLTVRDGTVERPAIIPGFVMAFVVLVILNSFGAFPVEVKEITAEVSRWALLMAIGALGLKTSLREIAKVGRNAIALLVVETLFITGFMLLALSYLPT